jgi:protein-tyrosine phosphatase
VSGPELVVAFLCTGNRFRSPLAAALLAEQAHGFPAHIESLGTLDLGPIPALPEAVAAAETFGLDLSGHRARGIVDVDLAPFDLVIGFERAHVAAAVVDGGAQLERTFTLPELVELLREIPEPPPASDPVERARVRIREAHAARPPDFRNRPVLEVADPLGKPRSAQDATAVELRSLVSTLAHELLAS